jgi:hypothetical protein
MDRRVTHMMASTHSHDSKHDTHWCKATLLFGPLLCLCVVAGPVAGRAQQSDAPQAGQDNQQVAQQTGEPDLTEGLLDLLKERKLESGPPSAPGSQGQFRPGDVGLEREDLGENMASPLISVRQSMLIAAGLIQRGATGSETQRLQADIVQRLDELIEQLEQKPGNQRQEQQPEQQQSEQNQAGEQQAEQQQAAQQQARQSTAQMRDESDGEELSQSDGEPQQPGVQGREATGELRLADPKALQQDVWGHLPERMRAQMQSRMVEQFLPSYREQIEAYFRALLEQP